VPRGRREMGERERGLGASVGSARRRNAADNGPQPSGLGDTVVAEQGRAAGCGRRGATRLTAGPGESGARCQRQGAGGREESEAAQRWGTDMQARVAQCWAARFQTWFEPNKNSNGFKPISNSFKLSSIQTGLFRSLKVLNKIWMERI
jgi:hypothetical protein